MSGRISREITPYLRHVGNINMCFRVRVDFYVKVIERLGEQSEQLLRVNSKAVVTELTLARSVSTPGDLSGPNDDE